MTKNPEHQEPMPKKQTVELSSSLTEEELLSRLVKDLTRVEESLPANVPDLRNLQAMLSAEKEAVRRRSLSELVGFVFAAMTIVGGFFLLLLHATAVLIPIQIGAMVVPLLLLLWRNGARGRRRKAKP
ncbi:YxlC family protein [Gorillibacterium sp. CAU 1737]|uniref:YxlC family protein n=1 Tax=Gorillibacterium sp. CAU 1737 TaxID=3140362 RepID=UPI0032617133